ncbi:MAG: hypothetical protein GY926_18730 [bacterium]|nr:hypothetical protein [bacterium]
MDNVLNRRAVVRVVVALVVVAVLLVWLMVALEIDLISGPSLRDHFQSGG